MNSNFDQVAILNRIAKQKIAVDPSIEEYSFVETWCGLINPQLPLLRKRARFFQRFLLREKKRGEERERERERPTDKNQLECHVDKRRAYFPVIVFTIPHFHESIIVVELLALTFREGFLGSISGRRTPDCQPEKNLVAKRALVYVSYVTSDRLSIYHANAYDDGGSSNRMWDRSLAIYANLART